MATIPKANHLCGPARDRDEAKTPWSVQGAACLVGPMKTQRPPSPGKSTQDNIQPSPETVRWKTAVPLRVVRGDLAGAVGEWRPGESAKRGYEKAVEDWWWL